MHDTRLRSALPAICLASLALGLAGCQRGGTVLDMKIPSSAARPSELSRLDVFVGEWSGTGEHRDLRTGEVTAFSGSSTTRWVSNGRFLLSEGVRERAGVSSSYTSMTAWDPERAIYRHWNFEGDGSVVAGEDWRPQADGTWRILRRVGNERIESVITLSPDATQMNVSYTIWSDGGGVKIATGTGVATKRR